MGNLASVFTTGSSWFKFSGTEYQLLTGLTFNEVSDKIECTTVSTVSGYKQYLPLRSEATFNATIYMDSSSVDIPLRSEGAVTASFNGKKYFCLATCYNKSTEGSIDGLIGQTYEFTANGAVSSSLS